MTISADNLREVITYYNDDKKHICQHYFLIKRGFFKGKKHGIYKEFLPNGELLVMHSLNCGELHGYQLFFSDKECAKKLEYYERNILIFRLEFPNIERLYNNIVFYSRMTNLLIKGLKLIIKIKKKLI